VLEAGYAALSMALGMSPTPAPASVGCVLNPAYGRVCRAEVRFDRFQQTYQPQYLSQWCWAACISMLFDYYGHPVAQQRIVSEVYGRIVDLPAGSGFVVAQELNRRWRDDRGRPFRSRLLAVFDVDANVMVMDNRQIVSALGNEEPLIIGTRSHAVVMTAVDFVPTPMEPTILQVGVFDP
jgi:hypothetical protein